MIKKSGMFGWVWWQNSSKRHLKIDRSRFFIFFEINEKKGVLKQNPLNKKSRKLHDDFVDANSVNSNCWWSNDHFTIKNVDHGNDQVLNKNQQKSNVLSGIMIFRTCTTLFIFSILGVFWKTHLKMCFNRDIDETKSH